MIVPPLQYLLRRMRKLHSFFRHLLSGYHIFLSASNVDTLLQSFHGIGAFHLAAYECSGKVVYIHQFGFQRFGIFQHFVHAIALSRVDVVEPEVVSKPLLAVAAHDTSVTLYSDGHSPLVYIDGRNYGIGTNLGLCDVPKVTVAVQNGIFKLVFGDVYTVLSCPRMSGTVEISTSFVCA